MIAVIYSGRDDRLEEIEHPLEPKPGRLLGRGIVVIAYSEIWLEFYDITRRRHDRAKDQ